MRLFGGYQMDVLRYLFARYVIPHHLSVGKCFALLNYVRNIYLFLFCGAFYGSWSMGSRLRDFSLAAPGTFHPSVITKERFCVPNYHSPFTKSSSPTPHTDTQQERLLYMWVVLFVAPPYRYTGRVAFLLVELYCSPSWIRPSAPGG